MSSQAEDVAVVEGLLQEITDRKQTERRLRAALDEKDILLKERERLLANERTLRDEAERLLHIKDEFLSTVSHELRTPLNSISGWAHLLLDGYIDSRNAKNALETIVRSVRTQTQIIDDLTDVAAIITGKLRLNLQQVDINESLHAVLEGLRPAAQSRNVHLDSPWRAGHSLMMRADPTRLQQIIWNLLSNAIKFTDPGGRVRVEATRDDAQIVLLVKDTGCGISPEFLPYVFDRFSQADSSSTRSKGGLGLGLSLVRHLTELHGGTVDAASEGLGRGATFTVRLPAAAEPSRSADPLESQVLHNIILSGLKVLVVDDDREVCDLLEVVLNQSGAHTSCLTSAKQALEYLERKQPDLMIFDVAMPERDGYHLISDVRSRGITVPAIALTAYARPEDRMHALAAGFQLHIGKPVDPMELVIAAANLCGRIGQARS